MVSVIRILGQRADGYEYQIVRAKAHAALRAILPPMDVRRLLAPRTVQDGHG
jgi:hypothetical protein